MKKITILLSAIISTSAFASHPEKVTMCLDVRTNYNNHEFYAKFVSSDYFDSGSSITSSNGQKCISHTYKSGPKNIILVLNALTSEALTITTSNCRSLYPFAANPNNFMSGYLRSYNPEVLYTFHISEILKDPTERKSFKIDCEFSQ